ncbi:MAG: asparagine synthase (glutamine-hydrolyzing) [Rhodospirillaceae bacterium]|nr:asparagine synthase (glutamine-hydrolyzing) [Rhodospirillaceae bacterium]|tara:strand:+ start:1775 stop:3607 length:1833 start_codon:yes stop_codon:yes gene_type:complete
MCGIAGAIGRLDILPERIKRTLQLMKQRGPDGTNARIISMGNVRVTLLFSRLSIIDLEPRAMQPFTRGKLTIVTNGELYNHIELKAELSNLGHSFQTQSDTEVMLAAWQQWGARSLDKMEGMWAFALFDEGKGLLTLCRDRFGEKPLYMWTYKGVLYFGSEPKYIAALAGKKPDVNQEQIRRFLVNGYKSLYKNSQTFLNDVQELPAAHYLSLSSQRKSRPVSYWSLSYEPQNMSQETAIEGARYHLKNSVHLRMRADVPVAFCLSGGIDSTTLCGIAAKEANRDFKTFSILDGDERYNEKKNIDAQVKYLGCSNHKIRTSKKGFFDRLSKLVGYHDKPVATLSYYMHSFMSEEIAKSGCRVAISGNGADELFAGYYDHYSFWLAEMRNETNFPKLKSDWAASYGAFIQNPKLQDPMVFSKNPFERGHIYLNAEQFCNWLIEPFNEPFTEKKYCVDVLRNRMLNEIKHETIPVIQHEDDRNSMFYSVENRSPYLDKNLAEFLFTVPSKYLIYNGYAKYLLRSASEGYVCKSVLWDKRKRGFNAPMDSLIDRKDSDTRERLLSDGPVFDLVRRDAIEAFLDQDLTANSLSKNLFSFISVKLFLDHYRDWKP